MSGVEGVRGPRAVPSRRAFFGALAGSWCFLRVDPTTNGAPSLSKTTPTPAQAAFFGVGSRGEFPPLPSEKFTDASGLEWYDYVVGKGPEPQFGQVVILRCNAYVLQSSAPAPASGGGNTVPIPYASTFTDDSVLMYKLGNGRYIRGLDEGVRRMRVGGKRRLVVPSSLGYDRGVILGPKPLKTRAVNRFKEALKGMGNDGRILLDVELVDAFTDEADPGYYEDTDLEPKLLEEILQREKEIYEAITGVSSSSS